MAKAGSSKLVASVIGAIGVTLWATETTLVNLAPRVPPIETVALAFMFAAMLTPISWLLTKQNPLVAFKLPVRVWVLMVGSLVAYHCCIYFATQRAPAAPAAMLQGTTPLLIVIGSAFLPGERLRWYHLLGAGLGLLGVLSLINFGEVVARPDQNAALYLSIIGVAAGLWGLYSVVTRSLPEVPTVALGVFYGASSLVAFGLHLPLEQWVMPEPGEWLAIAAMGFLPMGLAIYMWDYGVKKGDIQALGVFAYTEPFIGAVLVALVTHAAIGVELFWSGALVISGAVVASAALFRKKPASDPIPVATLPNVTRNVTETPDDEARQLSAIGNHILNRLVEIERSETGIAGHVEELGTLIKTLGFITSRWDRLLERDAATTTSIPHPVTEPTRLAA